MLSSRSTVLLIFNNSNFSGILSSKMEIDFAEASIYTGNIIGLITYSLVIPSILLSASILI
jgi:hypothetical protein